MLPAKRAGRGIWAMLHHPEYRSKYAENLKRELPRIPLVRRAGGAL